MYSSIICWIYIMPMHKSFIVILTLMNGLQISLGNSLDFYVDPETGQDTAGCGAIKSPCKTLLYSWTVAKDKNQLLRFNLSPGVYKSSRVLDLNCNREANQITFRGQEGRTNATRILINILISTCNLTFHDVAISNSITNIRHFYQFSSVTLNRVMLWSSAINIVSEESSIIVDSSIVHNCTSIKEDYPILVMKSISNTKTELRIKNTNISYSKAPFSFVENVKQIKLDTIFFMFNSYTGGYLQEKVKDIMSIIGALNMTMRHINFIKNENFTISVSNSKAEIVDLFANKNTITNGIAFLTFQSSEIRLWNSSFIENEQFGGGVLLEIEGTNTFLCSDCLFECNMVNRVRGISPIRFSVKQEDIDMRSSTSGRCPVICNDGYYLKNNLLCLPCKKGMFLTSQYNTTTTLCNRCPVGMYSDTQAAFKCKACPANTYCSTTGCVNCVQCKNDFFRSGVAATSCNKPTILLLILVVVTALLIFIPAFGLLLKWRRKEETLVECISQEITSAQEDSRKLIVN